MFQIAAALLFAVAAGLGVAVIALMLKTNRDAILSALLGEGAFPFAPAPRPDTAPRGRMSRRPRRDAPRPAHAAIRAGFSRAA